MGKILTAPVTDELLGTLAEIEAAVKRTEDVRTNDHEYYGIVVALLEQLVKDIMRARTADSLLSPKTGGARFRVDSMYIPMGHLDDAVVYLCNDAVNLLKHGGAGLSRFGRDNVDVAVSMLTALYGAIGDSVRHIAAADLALIENRGMTHLVSTADLLSRIANGDMDPKTEAETQDQS